MHESTFFDNKATFYGSLKFQSISLRKNFRNDVPLELIRYNLFIGLRIRMEFKNVGNMSGILKRAYLLFSTRILNISITTPTQIPE